MADSFGDRVGVVIVGQQLTEIQSLIAAGADYVRFLQVAKLGQNTFASAAVISLQSCQPRIVLLAGDSWGRECACRIAARCGWRLASPALMIQAQPMGSVLATVLDTTGKFAKRIEFAAHETVIATIRSGVGEALPLDPARTGTVESVEITSCDEAVIEQRFLPAEPSTADIRHVSRLVAGGRGLGSREGFDRLRQVAKKLDAGIAASRAVVDAGWIEYERQVGQTGKTVKPDLYLACGISGASHHLEGMSDSRHIISINNDADAPIHQKAHLALVADLYEVFEHLECGLNS